MMLEMALVYFVSALGASAVATVGLTESVLTLVYAVAIGLSMGTTALVARRIGEKNPDAAADTAAQALFIAVGASIPEHRKNKLHVTPDRVFSVNLWLNIGLGSQHSFFSKGWTLGEQGALRQIPCSPPRRGGLQV
jgi:hypothetical protein